MKIAQRRLLHLVNAFDLANEELGIADHLQGFGAVFDCIFKRANEGLILGKIIGPVSQILTQGRDLVALGVVNDYAVTRRAWVATGAPVGMCNQVILWRGFHLIFLPQAWLPDARGDLRRRSSPAPILNRKARGRT